MLKSRNIIYTALFLALVLLLWVGLSFLPGPGVETLPPETTGSYDLTGTDFRNTVYTLSQSWETWPDKLYTPAELAAAGVPQPHETQDFSALPAATHRLTLRLAPGQTYGITGRSSDYAMRLYLNGEEVVTVGNPAETPEENTPRVQPFEYYFTPQAETVEIVVQASNHVHFRNGSMAPVLTIGTAQNIAAHERTANIKTGILFGCLVLAFFYYLAAFLLNRRQRASLLFALLCLAMGLLSVEGFATLSPGYNWQLLYRLSYVCTLGATVLLVQLVHSLFPGTVHRFVRWGYFGYCGAYLLVALLVPTLFVTRLLGVFWAVTAAVIAWCLLCLVRTLRQRQLKNALAVLGVGLFALFALLDILHRLGVGPAWFTAALKLADAAFGMVLLVGCYALVLAIDQAEGNTQLEHARGELAKAEASYQKLLEEQGSKQTPSEMLAGYGLSGKQVEVALLLLNGKSRAQIAELMALPLGTVNYHCNTIYKKTGANGVVGLVGLLAPGVGEEG